MAERRQVALVYQYNENWIGGTYYIENLISALKLLPDEKQPALHVFAEKEEHFDKLRQTTGYAYLQKGAHRKKLSLLQRAVNKISFKLSGTHFFGLYQTGFDLLFPADIKNLFIPKTEYLYWIPDFQEHFLPEFFTEEELLHRRNYQQQIAARGKNIVFSSSVAQQHFNDIYPHSAIRQFVLPFAVSHQPLKDDSNVVGKYRMPERFYICSNQFWRHKNHAVVLEAIALLKEKGQEIFVAFTGKEHDYRYPEYFNEIKALAFTKAVEPNIVFLGFIDRNDQLSLMQKSIAVIQPSLFEGWSTVVEDAKSLGSYILASGIDVHKEQLKDYEASRLFDPADAASLADCLLSGGQGGQKHAYNYQQKIEVFGNTFHDIVENICSDK